MCCFFTLNIRKTNFVIFCPAQRKLTFQPNITIFDNDKNKNVSLESKEFVKYLGIFIAQNLTCKHHIDHVALKISRYVGLLSKLRHHVPTHTLVLITIYRSRISPHLTYGLLAWGQACKSHLEKLLKLQNVFLDLFTFLISNNTQYLYLSKPVFYCWNFPFLRSQLI